MLGNYKQFAESQLAETRAAGLWKPERVLASPQNPEARLESGDRVLILCANNYLGLADDPRVVVAARNAVDRWGYGMASVRFICGTQELHKELEKRIAEFVGTEDAILFLEVAHHPGQFPVGRLSQEHHHGRVECAGRWHGDKLRKVWHQQRLPSLLHTGGYLRTGVDGL